MVSVSRDATIVPLHCDIKNSVTEVIQKSKKSKDFVRRKGAGSGKPLFPEVNIADVPSINLKNFAGPDCWKFFEVTGIDSLFLSQPVGTWCTLDSWIAASEMLQELQVKNDAAERGVKLGHSFLERANIEQKLP